jgi:TPR repeat protein
MPVEQGPAAAAKQAARKLLETSATGARVAAKAVRRVKTDLSGPARQGDVAAQNLLGAIELEIEGKPKSARQWFEMSADLGDAVGQRSLGHLYANGLGVKTDVARAVELFRLAAAGGDLFAQYNLAAANVRAEGAYCTFDETLDLLESAARGGVVEAAAKLGDLLAQVDRDSDALDWYIRAATAGHVGAMNAAACWFRDGTAGEPDPVQAVRWFLAMLNEGNGDGVHGAIEVARGMTPDAIRTAALLAGRPDDGAAIIATLAS